MHCLPIWWLVGLTISIWNLDIVIGHSLFAIRAGTPAMRHSILSSHFPCSHGMIEETCNGMPMSVWRHAVRV